MVLLVSLPQMMPVVTVDVMSLSQTNVTHLCQKLFTLLNVLEQHTEIFPAKHCSLIDLHSDLNTDKVVLLMLINSLLKVIALKYVIFFPHPVHIPHQQPAVNHQATLSYKIYIFSQIDVLYGNFCLLPSRF